MPGFANAQLLPGDQIGLEKGFALLSNDLAAAKSWLTPARVRQLTTWRQSNLLQANRAASDPHLWVTSQGLRMVFRGKYNHPDQVDAIARLDATMTKE